MLSCSFGANAIDLSKVNFSYLYDGSLELENQIMLKSDTFQLFLSLNKKPEAVNFYFQNEYQDKKHQQIQVVDSSWNAIEERHVYGSKFKNLIEYKLLVIELSIKGVKYYYDVQVNDGIELNHPDFLIHNTRDSTLIFKNYLSKKMQISFFDSTVCYAYQRNFSPALPPMITKKPIGQKKLLLDSIFTISQSMETDSLNQLFFFQSDSSTNLGRGMVTAPSYFPKLKTSEELIEPLIYISTKSEFNKLDGAKNKKKNFENFWIQTLKSKERAKESIKKYYRNVTKANQYFTNYKQGWKTDVGMIYIIFGAPNSVQKNAKKEKWNYTRFGEEITFNFEKIPNLFVRQHLRLQRDNAYSKIWLTEVSSWRKGNL
jgi:GWxTD domain-containing protein